MEFIIYDYPEYCLGCGTWHHITQQATVEFYSGKVIKCGNCGTSFQFVPRQDIVELAALHGEAEKLWMRK